MNSGPGGSPDSFQGAGSTRSMREDYLTQAVRFLSDPRTRSASQGEKEDFLRKKGLTEDEIRTAFERYQSTKPQNDLSNNQPVYVRPAFMDEPILWSAMKSIFSAVGAMAIGVIGYHMYAKEIASMSPLASHDKADRVNPDGVWMESTKGVSEEKFMDVIQELTAKQELRHKEIMVSIRELSSRLSNISSERKPGGTVVIESVPVSESSTASTSEGIAIKRFEDIDVLAEVKSAIETGVDATLLLLLASLDNNKRINLTNPRFKKLSDNTILRHVGYKEEGEFLVLPQTSMDESRIKAQQVLMELRKARDAPRLNNEVLTSQPSNPPNEPCPDPWLPQASVSSPTTTET